MTGVPLLTASPAFTAVYPNALLIVRLAFGADLSNPGSWIWTDITTDLTQRDGQVISISPVGRSDYTSKTQPAACTFMLNNDSGAYSKGPQSSNYPNIHQNVPVQVLVTFTGDIADAKVLFQGEVWSFRPSWNLKGNIATVAVRAAGKLRQLQQGASPLRSALYRTLTQSQFLFAYWPCEDAAGSQQAASAISGVAPLILSGSLDFGSALAPAGSASAVASSGGGSLSASLLTASSGNWDIEAWVAVDVSGSNVQPILSWTTTGTVTNWELRADASGTYIEWVAGGTHTVTTLFDSGTNPFAGNTDVHRIDVYSNPGGPYVQLYVDGVLNNIPVDMTGQTFGEITSITVNPPSFNTSATNTNLLSFSHLFIAEVDSFVDVIDGAAGYAGETVTDRLTRLFGEEGISIDITGTSDVTMGPQGIDTFVNLARACEAADQGVLGDGLGAGCYYVARSARYNQSAAMTLDASAGELAAAPQPEDDDQYLRNKYTVTRKGGSSATFTDTDGPLGTATVGTYDSTPGSDLNVETDAQLPNIAAWLVHLGTVDGYRYPTLAIDLRNIPAQAGNWAGMSPGNRLSVTNVAAVSPEHQDTTIDVLAEGWSQQLSPVVWTATLNCSSAAPWDVVVLDETFRLEMTGQTLGADLVPGATTISIATATGHQLFTTSTAYPADFPIDLDVDGWKVHVTANTDGTTPQVAVCDATPNTSTVPAGTIVKLYRPASLAL